MNIYRSICIYDKKTNEFIRDIELSTVSFQDMKNFVIPKLDDPLFYDPYPISKEAYTSLARDYPELTSYKWEEFEFFLEAFQDK